MSTLDFNTGEFNWRIYASNIRANTGQNLTLDASNIDLSNNNLVNVNNINFLNNQIKIGLQAGQTNQGTNAIAIGQLAGGFSQGQFSIAIGAFAGPTGATANSIILNATGTGMTGIGTTGGTYIAPIRNVTQTTVLGYNIANNEVTYYVPTVAETNNLYDDFFSCPSNNPNTPLGPLGIQASTTSTFLSAYTGTKISGKCGIIRLNNPTGAQAVPWDIYNSQPISFSDLPILNPNNNTLFSQTAGWSLSLKHFMNGTSDTNIFTNSNVIQFIGIFGGTTGTGPIPAGSPTTFPTPNWFYTVQWTSGTNVELNYYLDSVLQAGSPFTIQTSTFQNWYTFKIVRTGNNTFRVGGLFSTSSVTMSNINTGLYLRCGSYPITSSPITQNTFIYVDFVGVELNTRTS